MSFLTDLPIDVAAMVARATRPGDGGIAVFLGVVRDNADGRTVTAMRYDAFPEMAEREMARIAGEVADRWPDVALALVHRTGFLEVGEASVAIVASSPHREEAFAACRHAIERIKERVPVWKKEFGPGGEVWVEGTASPEISSEGGHAGR